MASVLRLGIPAQEQSAIMPDVRIFLSGAQTEFVRERTSLHGFPRVASTAQRFFESSRFEELGEHYRRPDQADRQETGKDHVYVGLLGIEYGNEDEQGIFPAERESDCASAARSHRPISVSNAFDGIVEWRTGAQINSQLNSAGIFPSCGCRFSSRAERASIGGEPPGARRSRC